MVADVSYSVSGGDATETAAPITRDFLGRRDLSELDLDSKVPCGWEKRLDLKSGKVHVRKCSSSNSHLQDLNMLPITLNLFAGDPPAVVSSDYVCTLDKVKSALERVERDRKRSSSTSSSSVIDDVESDLDETASTVAGCPKCLMYVLISRRDPKCPRCRSEVPLPVAAAAATAAAKKPKIDLNISI